VQKLKKIALLSLLSILIVGIAFGVLKYQEKITNTVTVTGYELQLWRVDTNARVTSIAWGGIDQGLNKTSDTAFGFTQKLTIKNVGDYEFWAAWKLNSTLPNGATVTAQFASSEGSPWSTWTENTYDSLSSMSPGEVNSRRIQFILNIPDGTPRGPVDFDILVLAGSTSSG
jgi:hypothetical protein